MKRSLTYRGFFRDALSHNAGFFRTLLHRGALVAGILAIIAGIFGMHVMTGNHAAHGDHAAVLQAAASHPNHADAADAGARHAAVVHTLQGHTVAVRTVAADFTSCAGSCHGVQESGTSCVRLAFPAAEGSRTGPAVAYAHTPASPTPCELSISRT
ncbi:MAG: hypothetical protein NVS2B15_20960 [Pseudarthrobacter sp.]